MKQTLRARDESKASLVTSRLELLGSTASILQGGKQPFHGLGLGSPAAGFVVLLENNNNNNNKWLLERMEGSCRLKTI